MRTGIRARLEKLEVTPPKTTAGDLLSPGDVESIYGIPRSTQACWRSENRYNFNTLALRLGRSVRYRKADIEGWLESRRGGNE